MQLWELWNKWLISWERDLPACGPCQNLLLPRSCVALIADTDNEASLSVKKSSTSCPTLQACFRGRNASNPRKRVARTNYSCDRFVHGQLRRTDPKHVARCPLTTCNICIANSHISWSNGHAPRFPGINFGTLAQPFWWCCCWWRERWWCWWWREWWWKWWWWC